MKKSHHLFLIMFALLLTGQISLAHDHQPLHGLNIQQHIKTPLHNAGVLSVLTVTLEPGYREPLHTHPGEEVIYVVSGRGNLWVNGKATELVPGNILRVSQGQKKALQNTSDSEPLVILAYLSLEKDKPPLNMVKPDNG